MKAYYLCLQPGADWCFDAVIVISCCGLDQLKFKQTRSEARTDEMVGISFHCAELKGQGTETLRLRREGNTVNFSTFVEAEALGHWAVPQ
jgi:hypothetical protein